MEPRKVRENISFFRAKKIPFNFPIIETCREFGLYYILLCIYICIEIKPNCCMEARHQFLTDFFEFLCIVFFCRSTMFLYHIFNNSYIFFSDIPLSYMYVLLSDTLSVVKNIASHLIQKCDVFLWKIQNINVLKYAITISSLL